MFFLRNSKLKVFDKTRFLFSFLGYITLFHLSVGYVGFVSSISMFCLILGGAANHEAG